MAARTTSSVVRAARRRAGSAARDGIDGLAGATYDGLAEGDGDAPGEPDGTGVATGVGRGVGTGPETGGNATGIGSP